MHSYSGLPFFCKEMPLPASKSARREDCCSWLPHFCLNSTAPAQNLSKRWCVCSTPSCWLPMPAPSCLPVPLEGGQRGHPSCAGTASWQRCSRLPRTLFGRSTSWIGSVTTGKVCNWAPQSAGEQQNTAMQRPDRPATAGQNMLRGTGTKVLQVICLVC